MQKQLNSKVMEYNPVGYTIDCEPFATYNIPFVNIGNENLLYYHHTFSDDISHISFSRIERISLSLVDYLYQYNH